MCIYNIWVIVPDSKKELIVIMFIKHLAQSLIYNKHIKVAIIYGCNVGSNVVDG